MKDLMIISFLTLIVSTLIAGCTGQSKTDNALQKHKSIEDSVIVSTLEVPEIVRGRVIEDTIIGHWTIKTTKDSNEIVVGDEYWTVKDSSVFLTLAYDDKIIYSDKEIRTKDITGSEGEFFMHWGGEVFWASDSAIYLLFGCFIPNSDDGWIKLYQIIPDGTSNLKALCYEMGVDGNNFIVDFMALYLNEKVVGASAADLKRLYEHFCTKELAEELSAATLPIVSDDTDFRHADRTLQINSLDDIRSFPLEKFSFEVIFKPNPNDDNVTDTLYMEVDDSTNKISKIETGERKVSDSISQESHEKM